MVSTPDNFRVHPDTPRCIFHCKTHPGESGSAPHWLRSAPRGPGVHPGQFSDEGYEVLADVVINYVTQKSPGAY